MRACAGLKTRPVMDSVMYPSIISPLTASSTKSIATNEVILAEPSIKISTEKPYIIKSRFEDIID